MLHMWCSVRVLLMSVHMSYSVTTKTRMCDSSDHTLLYKSVCDRRQKNLQIKWQSSDTSFSAWFLPNLCQRLSMVIIKNTQLFDASKLILYLTFRWHISFMVLTRLLVLKSFVSQLLNDFGGKNYTQVTWLSLLYRPDNPIFYWFCHQHLI